MTGHPVLAPGERPYFRETLAWARIDLDLVSSEALVEEIQSDWVRCANRLKRRLSRCGSDQHALESNAYSTTVDRARMYFRFVDNKL